jgi:hypothetical protein
MTSISGGSTPAGGFQTPSGVQLGGMGGEMPEGGGSFYMGGDEQGQEGQQKNQQNPELVIVDQGEVDKRSQNRQYLENLITGKETSWANPWGLAPDDNLRVRGRKDIIIKNNAPKANSNRQFIVNA